MAKDKKKTSDTAAASEQEDSNTKSAKADTSDADKKAKSDKKSGKKSKKDEKQLNFFQKIGKWFHDLKIEFKNVTWPTRQTVITNTSVVLAVLVSGSIIIGLIDSGLFKLMQFLLSAANN